MKKTTTQKEEPINTSIDISRPACKPGSFLEQLSYLDALHNYIQKKVEDNLKSLPQDVYESKDTDQINEALSKAQGSFPKIGYNKENPYFKNKYTDLDSIIHATKPALSKNGLAITQQIKLTDQGTTVLETKVRHTSGQWIGTKTRITPIKSDPQSFASFLTYMKRYSFTTLLGVTTSDDTADDDAETTMFDLRETRAKGTALNTKYNPKENPTETITKEQIEEFEYELGEHQDVTDMILEGFRIQSIADMPKSKFLQAINRTRKIIKAREGAIQT